MNLDETYYAPRGDEGHIRSLHIRTERTDGDYDVSPAMGGWVRIVPRSEFDAHFVEVPRSMIEARLSEFRHVRLTYADEGDEFIEGFVNDECWNGWRLPFFTREVLLSSQSHGLLSGMSKFVQIVEDISSGDLFMALSSDQQLPDGLTSDHLSSVMGNEEYVEDGSDQFWRLRPMTIVHDDEAVTVYDTSGVGWTWMIHPDHVEASVPGAR